MISASLNKIFGILYPQFLIFQKIKLFWQIKKWIEFYQILKTQ